jgi:hypothetical protein
MPKSIVTSAKEYKEDSWVISIMSLIIDGSDDAGNTVATTAIIIEGEESGMPFVNKYEVKGIPAPWNSSKGFVTQLVTTKYVVNNSVSETKRHREEKDEKPEREVISRQNLITQLNLQRWFIGSVNITPANARAIMSSIEADEEAREVNIRKLIQYEPVPKDHPLVRLFGFPQAGDHFAGWCWEKLRLGDISVDQLKAAIPKPKVSLLNEYNFFLAGFQKWLCFWLPLHILAGLVVLPLTVPFSKKKLTDSLESTSSRSTRSSRLSKLLTPLKKFIELFDIADPYVGRDTSTYDKICKKGKWARYKFLMRNPLNYLGYKMGFIWSGKEKYVYYDDETSGVGNSSNGKPGFQMIDIIRPHPHKPNEVERFKSRRLIYNWQCMPGECVEYWNGKKIGDPYTNAPNDHIQIVGRVAVMRTYKGAKRKETPANRLSTESSSSSSTFFNAGSKFPKFFNNTQPHSSVKFKL